MPKRHGNVELSGSPGNRRATVREICRAAVYEPITQPSRSMQPTLARGDDALVSRLAYRVAPPRRGDVIVFRPRSDPTVQFVSRIVGVPGDRIQLVDGTLRINGVAAQLRDLGSAESECGDSGGCEDFELYAETLPGGRSYRIMRLEALGYYENSNAVVVPAHSYFVLGDNRDEALDSRRDEVGFVPESSLVGKAAFKFHDGRAGRATWQAVP